ncbi:MAG: LPS export ABC transporter periplasmic protein LptC, partial [Verrucomicrobiota bacterium]
MKKLPFSLVAFTALLASSATGEDERPDPSPTPAEQANGFLQPAMSEQMTKLFPVGREFKGVSIPSYKNTRLESVLHAETIVRVDDRFLDLTNLVIEVYNGAEEAETKISMEKAAYDLTAGILKSKTPSKIEQPRFTMTGDEMTFYSNTQISELEGNVRVVVPDAGKM